MTTRILILAFTFSLAVSTARAWVGGPYPGPTGTDPVTAFEKAVQMEEVKGDISFAGVLYGGLLAEGKLPPGIRIEAEIRMARCLMKQGKADAAEAGLKNLAGRLRAERLPAEMRMSPSLPGNPPRAKTVKDEPPASLEVNGKKYLPEDTVGLVEESLASAMKELQSVPGGADRQRLLEGAIEGMARAASRHSSYMPAAVTKSFQQTMENDFCGIGAVLLMGENVEVKQVIPGSPAEAAGIKSGTAILEIDGRSPFALGGKLTDVVAAMRGPEGTEVKLLIKPPGGTAAEMTVKRARIPLNPGSDCGPILPQQAGAPLSWWVDEAAGIAGVKLSSFFVDDKTTASGRLKAALNDPALAGGRVKGFILDLTGNGGGSLDEAVKVADLFLTEGVVVKQRSAEKGDFDVRSATPGQMLAGVPMAVLINGSTASAAEVVAAALQHHKRATVIGVRSFGRGVILTLKSLPNGGSVTVPTAELIAATGQPLERHEGMSERDSWGVTPDVFIEGFVNRAGGFGEKKLSLMEDGKLIEEADFIHRQSLNRAVEFLKNPNAAK